MGVQTMFCENCGKQIPDGTQVCPYCSAEYAAEEAPNTPPAADSTYAAPAPEPFMTNPYQKQQKPLDYSTISLVLGIVGLVFCFSCSGFIINIVGIVFGIKAKNESGRQAGLIMSIIGLVLAIITTIISIGWVAALISALSQNFGAGFMM